MKKIFAFLFLLGCLATAKAQQAQLPIPVFKTKTITAADTLVLPLMESNVVSLQATYLETTGTSAGKFYIEGTVDGRAWVNIDSSKSLSDVTTYQTVVVSVSATTYRDYRLRCSNTSSATGTLFFTALRRPDE